MLDLDAIEARAAAALQLINALNVGSRTWINSIPARLDHDPDLVLARSLGDIDDLIARVRQLESHANAFLDGIAEIRHSAAHALGVPADSGTALELVEKLESRLAQVDRFAEERDALRAILAEYVIEVVRKARAESAT